MIEPGLVPYAGETALLALWERGLQARAFLRGDALLQATASAGDVEPSSLGARNRRLLQLHETIFGGALDLLSHCPACGAAAQFDSTCSALLAAMPSRQWADAHLVNHEGYLVEFHLPRSEDVAAAASADDSETFARRLFAACVHACSREGVPVPPGAVPDSVLDAVSRLMEELDPSAHLSFAVTCPECASAWDASLDLDELLWTKVQTAAERVLIDVDILARAYGWTEREVLALPPLRRAAYLQLAGA